MADPRIEKLAKILVEHSVNVKKGEKIMIDASAEAAPLIVVGAIQIGLGILKIKKS